MREIKFRGIAQRSGKLVYGQLLRGDKGFNIVVDFKTNEHIKMIPILKGTQSQYTGLEDVNGVGIYEGDIVKGYYDEYNSFFDEVNRHEFISEVKYIDNSFKVHRNTLNDEGRIRDYGYVHEWDSELVEVIGNIYENKELLVVDSNE